jgi:multidrug efflux system membrane fusion protein
MNRLMPYLIFVLITGGLLAFINKDRIFPPSNDKAAALGSTGAEAGAGRRRGGGGGSRRANQTVPVTIAKAKNDNVPVYLNGVGTVQAYYTTVVRAQVSGRLTEVNFGEGEEVKTGDILAKIDPVLYQAVYDQAVAQKAKDEALLANARLDAKRYTDLVKTNSASQQQADTAVASVRQNEALIKQDQALIDNAKANLDYCTIRAPINGRTGIRLVDPGNLVSAVDATGIVVLTQLNPIAVVFTLPESTVADVLEAQSRGAVPLQAVVGGTVIGEGTLVVVDNQIDQTTGTIRIKGSFPNRENRLWPGQFVNVKLKLKTLMNAIVVPSVALQQGAKGSYVYTVTPENTAKLTYVKIIQEGERQAVIGEGVSPGDTIITSGFASLQDGAKIQFEASDGTVASTGTPASTQSRDGGEARQRAQGADEAAAEGVSQDGQRRGRRKRGEGRGEGKAGSENASRGQPGVARP